MALTGAILNADINASAAIAYSKLNLTGSVLDADLAGSISTAGKVSGSALTSLASIPSGAGVIPVANLPAFGLSFVSATTFSAENSKTISGLTTATPYLLILDLAQNANNEDLVFYPNGTLSAIEVIANYDAGSNKLRLHNSSGFGASTGSWHIKFRTLQGDTTKTAVILDGFDTGTVDAKRHSAYAVMDSDTALSSITIAGIGGTMTLTGTAYLYKYATS